MQFGYVKDLAEEVAGENVRDAVVTVCTLVRQRKAKTNASLATCRFLLIILNMNGKQSWTL